MFGKKKEAERGVPGFADTAKEGDDLDIPAPKAAPRSATAPGRAQGSGGAPFEAPKRPLSASASKPRSDVGPAPSIAPSAPGASAPSSLAAVSPAVTAESKKLVVGREIRLKGEVTSCDVLVVEGSVELSLTDARQIQVAANGLFSGKVEVDEADIAGQFEGELTVRDRLLVRSGGRVQGRIRYGNIVIESGGQISGEIESLSGESKRPTPIPPLVEERPAVPGNGGFGLSPGDFDAAAVAEER